MLTREERVNLVILTLELALGCVEEDTSSLVQEFNERMACGPSSHSEDEVNLLILALKAAGFNDELNADGVAGPQLQRGLGNFMILAEELGEEAEAAATEVPAGDGGASQ